MDASENSFLQKLQRRLTTGLKPVTTKTTFPDGFVQYTNAQGSLEQPKCTDKRGFGFVVDEKPDLTTGQITPWLFISSQDVPGDKNVLSKHGITRVLSLLPGYELPQETAMDITHHLVLDFYDEESFKLDSNLMAQSFSFISQAKSDCAKVVVHCNAGISRAPSVVIAYLMECENMSLKNAMQLVKSARPVVKPNAGFMQQLEEMERLRLEK